VFDVVDMNVKVGSFCQTKKHRVTTFKEKKLASEQKNPVDEIHCARNTHRDQIHKQSWSTNVKRTDPFVELEAGKRRILK